MDTLIRFLPTVQYSFVVLMSETGVGVVGFCYERPDLLLWVLLGSNMPAALNEQRVRLMQQ